MSRWDKIFLPVCVRLGDEQVMILPSAEGATKCLLRVREKSGELRHLTRDEELAYAAALGTRAERVAALYRVGRASTGGQLVVNPQPWLPGEEESALAQIERGTSDSDGHN